MRYVLFQWRRLTMPDPILSIEHPISLGAPLPSLVDAAQLLSSAYWWICPESDPWDVIWNEGTYRLYGLDPSSPPPNNRNYFRFTHPDDANVSARAFTELIASQKPVTWRARIVRPDGSLRHILTKACRVDQHADGRSWFAGIDVDITDQVDLLEAYERERAFRFVTENIRDVVLRCNAQGQLEFISRSVKKLLGYVPDKLMGLTVESLINATDYSTVYAEFISHARNREHFSGGHLEMRLRRADGSEVWVESSPRIVLDANGGLLGWVDVVRDITQRRAADAELAYLATHDTLTGLHNRAYFQKQLAESLSGHPVSPHILLCVDLDHFKCVNDSMGHPAGDAVLKQCAARLTAIAPANSVIGRMGGDEFAVLLRDSSPAESEELASALVQAMATPLAVDGTSVQVGVSIGLAGAPDDGVTADQLTKSADVAMYEAKVQGKGRYKWFDPRRVESIAKRREVQQGLKQALDSHRILVAYQPVIDAESETIVEVEALARWKRSDAELVSLLQFVDAAEEADLMRPLGTEVLRQALLGFVNRTSLLRLSVNISPSQLEGPQGVLAIEQAVASSSWPTHLVQLEISETALSQKGPHIFDQLLALKAVGFRLCLDDFQGQSSFDSIRRMDFDALKLDASMVQDVVSNAKTRAVIGGLALMARRLGLTLIAKGVESQKQREILQELGCEGLQGFYIAPPGLSGTEPREKSNFPHLDALLLQSAGER